MKVFRSLDDVSAAAGGRAVAVGTFDGVHLGHRQVIQAAHDWAREHQCSAAVVTFDPHPLQVLRPEDPPKLLTSSSVKEDLIETLEVDELIVIPFTPELSELEPEEFCAGALAGTIGARFVSVGENFHFGRGARGDANLLKGRPEFETAVVPIVQHDGGPVSSSRIRQLLQKGDIAAANALLGAPFQLEGVVVAGDARGRSLGVPTANLAVDESLLVPGPGIYAGLVAQRPAAISIGVRPTFESDGRMLVEVHLVGFQGDLYGQTMRVAFLERLRDEIRFDSTEELVEQMRRDIERVQEVAALW
jgi:riboflavin kinase/FMN adenylyltransferase